MLYGKSQLKEKMKAAQFVEKPLFELNEIAKPACPAGGLLVRIDSAAICGTDLKVMQCKDVKLKKGRVTRMQIPRVTGHEFSGVVEEVGSGVKDFKPGDKVTVGPTVPCLDCAMCSKGYHEMCENILIISYHCDGGFAELVALDEIVVKSNCVVKVPQNVSMEAAALTEPLSCAVNCLELSPVPKDGSVLVIGAGPLGLIIADLACCEGAKQVFIADISPEQLEKASVANADILINMSEENIEERIRELTDGFGAGLVITACSAPEAQQVALKLTAKRGWINFFGGLPRDRSVVPLDTNIIHYKELTVVGTHGSAPRHLARAIELQASGDMDLAKYIDCSYPLDRINDALKKARGKGRLKILIKPNE